MKFITNDIGVEIRSEDKTLEMFNGDILNSILFVNTRIRIHRDAAVSRSICSIKNLTERLTVFIGGDASFFMTHFYQKYYEMIEMQSNFLLAKIKENLPIWEDGFNIAEGLVDYIGEAYVSIERLLDEIVDAAKCEHKQLMADFLRLKDDESSDDGMPKLVGTDKHRRKRHRGRGQGRKRKIVS